MKLRRYIAIFKRYVKSFSIKRSWTCHICGEIKPDKEMKTKNDKYAPDTGDLVCKSCHGILKRAYKVWGIDG